MSEEIKTMRKDIEQLKAAIKTLSAGASAGADALATLDGHVMTLSAPVIDDKAGPDKLILEIEKKLSTKIRNKSEVNRLEITKSIDTLDKKLSDGFDKTIKRVDEDILKQVSGLDKKLSDKITKYSKDMIVDILKKYITREFITKLYRG